MKSLCNLLLRGIHPLLAVLSLTSHLAFASDDVDYFTGKAQQGDAEAQYELGRIYLFGDTEGVPQDYSQAVDWLIKSGKQGYVPAQMVLGWMYSSGQGAPQDLKQAYVWYSLATAMGEDPDRRAKEVLESAARLLEPQTLEQAHEEVRLLFGDIQARKNDNAQAAQQRADRYKDNGDGTVTDTVTRLTWQRCSVGQTWSAAFEVCNGEARRMSWEEASRHAAPGGFRLPTKGELRTLVFCSNTGKYDSSGDDAACGTWATYHTPAINEVSFPNTDAGFFWSSSPDPRYQDLAWLVSFDNGQGWYDHKTSRGRVRLVRAAD